MQKEERGLEQIFDRRHHCRWQMNSVVAMIIWSILDVRCRRAKMDDIVNVGISISPPKFRSTHVVGPPVEGKKMLKKQKYCIGYRSCVVPSIMMMVAFTLIIISNWSF